MWRIPMQLSLRTFTDSLNDSPYCTSSSWRHLIRPSVSSIHSNRSTVVYTYLRCVLRSLVQCVLLTPVYYHSTSVWSSTTPVRSYFDRLCGRPFDWNQRIDRPLLTLLPSPPWTTFFHCTGRLFCPKHTTTIFVRSDSRYYQIYLIYSMFRPIRISSTTHTYNQPRRYIYLHYSSSLCNNRATRTTRDNEEQLTKYFKTYN
jgi:hypothetical protein